VPRDQRRKWAYIFGAVCPARDTGAALVLPTANAKAMNLHLQEISSQVSPGAHAVLILDRAGWHRSGGKLRVPDNISLLYLPPYSPELNPAENVWQYLRQNFLSNRVYASYNAIVDACCNAWNALATKAGLMVLLHPCVADLAGYKPRYEQTASSSRETAGSDLQRAAVHR
jgi:transposase